jgi:predicted unusual protein kinase regulating ubiquinone biosynthesis (AarF/ABC1/UbiB family)
MLHCDINPGNVLLSNDNSIPSQTFIIDLDVARIESLTIQQPEATIEQSVSRQSTVLSSPEPIPPRTQTSFEATTMVKRGTNRMVGSLNTDPRSYFFVLKALYREQPNS